MSWKEIIKEEKTKERCGLCDANMVRGGGCSNPDCEDYYMNSRLFNDDL